MTASRTPFDVQGHRGARGLRPADTLAGFQHALHLGVSTLEMDAAVTSDGVVILVHDPYVNPEVHCYADGRALRPDDNGHGPLFCHLTFAETRELDAGRLKVPRFPRRTRVPGERIPALTDLLTFVQDTGDEAVEFALEVKFDPIVNDTVPYTEFVDSVVAVVEAFDLMDRFILQCFDLSVLEYARRIRPHLRTLWLLRAGDERHSLGNLENLADGSPSPWTNGLDWNSHDKNLAALLANVDYVDVLGIDYPLVLEAESKLGCTLEEIRAQALLVPWTVNEVEDMKRLIELGVDGMMSDYPDLLLQIVRASGLAVKNRGG